MQEFERWAHALALTESDDHPDAPLGDAGRAAGRWQMHPAFVWEYLPGAVGVEATWDALFSAVLKLFWWHRWAEHGFSGVDLAQLTLVAMEFHLGIAGVARGGWDDEYARRFEGYWLQAEAPATA